LIELGADGLRRCREGRGQHEQNRATGQSRNKSGWEQKETKETKEKRALGESSLKRFILMGCRQEAAGVAVREWRKGGGLAAFFRKPLRSAEPTCLMGAI
jgi:hypothetical protein